MRKAVKGKLTEKEAQIMNLLWSNGPMYVREMLPHYPEPRPHFNTVSTTVRILEDKGYVGHEQTGSSYRYFALASADDFRSRSLTDVVKSYFNNSYTSVVSALVEEEKISLDELKELVGILENRQKE